MNKQVYVGLRSTNYHQFLINHLVLLQTLRPCYYNHIVLALSQFYSNNLMAQQYVVIITVHNSGNQCY